MPTDPRIEGFFARPGRWQAELAALRAILFDCGLAEEFKWRGPCYTAAGGNIALMWGFKADCALGFFKGALMADPEGVLVPPGENSRAARVIRFTAQAQIEKLEPVIRAYVAEAVALQQSGAKLDLPKDDLEYPDELTARMEADPDFAAALKALTPGRQRGYVLHFSQAKQSATRAARIDKAAPRILAGKGWNER